VTTQSLPRRAKAGQLTPGFSFLPGDRIFTRGDGGVIPGFLLLEAIYPQGGSGGITPGREGNGRGQGPAFSPRPPEMDFVRSLLARNLEMA